MIAPLHVRPWSVTRADEGLTPERQAVILTNVMDALRAKHARREAAQARLAAYRLNRVRAAEGLDLASACGFCQCAFHAECARCFG